MKSLIFLILIWAQTAIAQNVIRIRATMIPNTGSFVATSFKAKGRLLKQRDVFSADRLSVFADSFKTENPLRDAHFIKHLSGGKLHPHPRIDLIQLKAQGGIGEAKIVINGITKQIKIFYKTYPTYVDAEFFLKNSDFQLPKVKYLGVGIEDKVKVEVRYFFETK